MLTLSRVSNALSTKDHVLRSATVRFLSHKLRRKNHHFFYVDIYIYTNCFYARTSDGVTAHPAADSIFLAIVFALLKKPSTAVYSSAMWILG